MRTADGFSDAFVALISTTLDRPREAPPAGDYLTYLGGSGVDQGTGIALDVNDTAYVAGTTQSSNFPTANPYQASLNGVAERIRHQARRQQHLVVSRLHGQPVAQPASGRHPGTFTFNITNNGTRPGDQRHVPSDDVPTTGIPSPPTATVSTGGGELHCPALGATLLCNIGTLAVSAVAAVQVDVTPTIPVDRLNPQITVSGVALSANGGGGRRKDRRHPTGQHHRLYHQRHALRADRRTPATLPVFRSL